MRSSHEKPRSRSGGAAGEPALSNIISKGIGLLAKEEFLNLSSGCFWYVAEDDCFGYLEPGHAVATERNYFRSEIVAFSRDRMAGFKVPKTIIFGDIPKTATGKVQKFLLREQANALDDDA